MGLRSLRRSAVLLAACLGALGAPAAASAATVSLWHMDETAGPTAADAVGRNHGALRQVGLGQPGLDGLAYAFDGASSVVTVPSSASLNPGASPFWLTAHVQFTDTPSAAIGGDYDVVRKGLSATTGGFYKMELMPTSKGVQAHCSMKGTLGSQSLTAGPDLRDGRWHTVQCAKDDVSLEVIVDGAVFSTPAVLGSFTNSAAFAIGAKAEGGDWYAGLLDEVSFGTGAPADPGSPASTPPPAVVGTAGQVAPVPATTGAPSATPAPTAGASATAACLALASRSPSRTRRLAGAGRIRLRFDARTATATLRAPRHGVRRVTLRIDGTRLRSVHRGGLRVVLRPAALGPGEHVLRAVVHPRHGHAQTLRLRLRVTAC